jgi:hypothetical protein
MMSAPLASARGAGYGSMPYTDELILIRVTCTPSCFTRITPATWSNHASLETVADRSAPVACGPHVDQVN